MEQSQKRFHPVMLLCKQVRGSFPVFDCIMLQPNSHIHSIWCRTKRCTEVWNFQLIFHHGYKEGDINQVKNFQLLFMHPWNPTIKASNRLLCFETRLSVCCFPTCIICPPGLLKIPSSWVRQRLTLGHAPSTICKPFKKNPQTEITTTILTSEFSV